VCSQVFLCVRVFGVCVFGVCVCVFASVSVCVCLACVFVVGVFVCVCARVCVIKSSSLHENFKRMHAIDLNRATHT